MDRLGISARAFTALVAVAAACGGDDGGVGGSGGSTTGVATTATVDAGSSSTGSSAGSHGSGSTGSESSESTDGSTGTIPDLAPHPTACDEPEALIDVAVASTPDGPMNVDEAWVWYDFCGSGPFVVLVQRPTIDGERGVQVEIELQADGRTPWLGSYPAAVRWEREATGTMELLEPFTDPHEPGTPHPDLHLHAQIEIDGGGYELSLEVDLIDCGVTDCSCPCR